MKKKILVAGGTGYIGSHTTVELQNAGYEVVIIDDLSNSNIEVLDGIEKITGIRPEFIALINYGIVGLIQLEKPFVDEVDMTPEEAMKLYDKHAQEALELMLKKNHDYDEAWRSMRVSSYTDFILTKIQRVKEIEDIAGATLVSEGIDANYMDIINYAVFGAIKMGEK